MKRHVSLLWLVAVVFALSSCGRSKKIQPETIGEGQLRFEVYMIDDFELQFVPTIVENAMPMSSGGTYAILQLKEINGKNIQQAFGLSQIVITSGVNIETYDVGEMNDFGQESPILEGVARGIKNVKFPLDKIVLKFYNLKTGESYAVDAKKVYSTIAY
jgi:hypothetical protein